MIKNILQGVQISLGIILGLSIFFGIVYAIGFHPAEEILGGEFNGNYTFNGTLNITNSQLTGLDSTLKEFSCLYSQTGLSAAWHYKTWITTDCEGYLPSNYNHCLINLKEANGAGASAWKCETTQGGAYTNGGQIVMQCSYLCWN